MLRLGRQLLDQVMRHARCERPAPAQQRDGSRVVGEEHRGLSGGVAAADQEDVASARAERLGARGAVVDAAADERIGARESRAARHATPVASTIVLTSMRSPPSSTTARAIRSSIVRDRRRLPRDENLDAEALRLLQRAGAQFVAGNAGREAEVVLDPRRRARLSARRIALDQDRAQAFRRSVDRGRESRRPAADDRDVVDSRRRRRLQAEPRRDFPERSASSASIHRESSPPETSRPAAASAASRRAPRDRAGRASETRRGCA